MLARLSGENSFTLELNISAGRKPKNESECVDILYFLIYLESEVLINI